MPVKEADLPTRHYNLPINVLGAEQFELKEPILALIDETHESAIARIPRFGLWAEGVTDWDALRALIDEIPVFHAELQNTPNDELGVLPLMWKQALAIAIEDKSAN